MSRWAAVRRWRDRLRAADLSEAETDLSPEGLRAAWDAALDALDDPSLDAEARRPGRPFPTAVLVTTATVPTAALEWLALLLGRGSRVVWKHPTGRAGLASVVAEAARDLPLHITEDRAAVAEGDGVIVLGSDETVARVRAAARPDAVVHAHGHAFSVAWVTGRPLPADPRLPEGIRDPWDRLAADLALHDGRGCLSPGLVLTPLPVEHAADALADALERAEARWPRGRVHPAEGAALRARRALCRATGSLREGPGWAVHALPAAHASPASLPRTPMVVHLPDAAAAAARLSPWARWLSAVGTDAPDDGPAFLDVGATRVAPLGRLQRPPLDRVHDGVRWTTQTCRAVQVDFPGHDGQATQ
jgi:hypothetical protein